MHHLQAILVCSREHMLAKPQERGDFYTTTKKFSEVQSDQWKTSCHYSLRFLEQILSDLIPSF